MIYVIVGTVLLIHTILFMDWSSFLLVTAYVILLRFTETILKLNNVCDPDKCPFYKPIENQDAYKKVKL